MNDLMARAMLSGAPADAQAALAQAVAAGRHGAGYAENAIQYASALGRIDTAFAVCEAYFFGRGFTVADLRFSSQQRTYTRRDSRRTAFLFYPSTAALRADPRFTGLAERLGLARYWRDTGVRPD